MAGDSDPSDRLRILERRRLFVLQALSGAVLAATGGCAPCLCVRPATLKPGGVYVAWVQDSSRIGRSRLARGDLIQEVDGVPVSTMDELEATGIADGQPHQLTVYVAAEQTITTIELAAATVGELPLLGVGAAELDRAPEWARRRLFAHASPRLMLIDAQSGAVLGSRDLLGRCWLLALFAGATPADRLNAALTMQVMQKAQADLLARGIGMIFAQVFHFDSPSPRMTAAELLRFFEDNQLSPREGGPLPPPPLFRSHDSAEYSEVRGQGLEGELTYAERLGESPNILVLDPRGIIRWHSAGPVPDPSGEIAVPMVYTINAAVMFALQPNSTTTSSRSSRASGYGS